MEKNSNNILSRQKGFNLIELFLIVSLITVLVVLALPMFQKYYRAYKYREYVLQVESTLKLARMIAMERGINVGICVENNTLRLVNMGSRRSQVCQGDNLRVVNVLDSFVRLRASGGGSAFDPRGLGIFSTTIMIERADLPGVCNSYTIQPLRGLVRRQDCVP